MKIITLTGNQFRQYAKSHKYRSYYQTVEYGKLMKIDGYDYHLLGFLNNSNELIGATMVLFKKIFFNYKIAYAPYGFLIDYSNSDLVEEITYRLKKLLLKQKFIYLKINPRIECSKRNKEGEIIAYNPDINNILEILQKNNYIHHGFNNYFEDTKPRWNAVLKLSTSNETLYKNFDKQVRNKISKAERLGVEIKEANDKDDINVFFQFIKRKHDRSFKYYQKLIKEFDENAKIYMAILNTRKYLQNSQENYEQELRNNDEINEKLQEASRTNTNIDKILNIKMQSDESVARAHKHLVEATKFYSKYPENIKIGGMLTIENKDEAYLIIEGFNKKYSEYDPNYLLRWELIKKFNKEGKQYFNMNGIVGEFKGKNKYSGLNESKLGYNADAVEYIGEFDYVINKTVYKFYKKKVEKQLKKNEKRLTK